MYFLLLCYVSLYVSPSLILLLNEEFLQRRLACLVEPLSVAQDIGGAIQSMIEACHIEGCGFLFLQMVVPCRIHGDVLLFILQLHHGQYCVKVLQTSNRKLYLL